MYKFKKVVVLCYIVVLISVLDWFPEHFYIIKPTIFSQCPTVAVTVTGTALVALPEEYLFLWPLSATG